MVGAGRVPNILITKWEDDTLCVVCMWRVESTTAMENSKLHPGPGIFTKYLSLPLPSSLHALKSVSHRIRGSTAVRIFQAIISLPITLQLQANEYNTGSTSHIYTFQPSALFFFNKSGRLKHFAPCLSCKMELSWERDGVTRCLQYVRQTEINQFLIEYEDTAVSRIFQAIISLPITLSYRIHLPHLYHTFHSNPTLPLSSSSTRVSDSIISRRACSGIHIV
eukprot:scaffold7285_cov78-Skeletonema_dohrnii-CCMP3373.AAC.2